MGANPIPALLFLEVSMEKEIWKPLIYRGEDFSDLFDVSNYGNIRNKITGKYRKPQMNHEGYLYCLISRGRKRKVAVKIHRAVAENFVYGDKSLCIDHVDGNRRNNFASNLEFVTVGENNLRAYKSGQTSTPKLSSDDIAVARKMRENGDTYQAIANRFHVHSSTAQRAIKRESYRWLE